MRLPHRPVELLQLRVAQHLWVVHDDTRAFQHRNHVHRVAAQPALRTWARGRARSASPVLPLGAWREGMWAVELRSAQAALAVGAQDDRRAVRVAAAVRLEGGTSASAGALVELQVAPRYNRPLLEVVVVVEWWLVVVRGV